MNHLVISGDGSHTVHSAQFDVPYHSKHGAIQESLHVFIEAGLSYFFEHNAAKTDVNVFEMGFGTGLNALLAYQYAQAEIFKMDYTTIEKFPLEVNLISSLNYIDQLGMKEMQVEFLAWHNLEARSIRHVAPEFTLNKIIGDILTENLPMKQDVVFFDAFAPSSQPELWSVDIFEKLFAHMSFNGVLVSYCAQGQFKRNLKSAGFKIESIPGPPGKREMTRAIKS